ncbi:Neutral zinc metallopeptidase [Planctomycetales bacterium 10988]|nr:Neutral zinc metallopeptidase [Planctomycetales bacterium 10988]
MRPFFGQFPWPLTDAAREKFDTIFEEVLAQTPHEVQEVLEVVPLILDDLPSEKLLDSLGLAGSPESLCGLYTGTPILKRHLESLALPDQIYVFRLGLLVISSQTGTRDLSELRRQMRITIMHEVGHHFGLDEDELDEAGYG